MSQFDAPPVCELHLALLSGDKSAAFDLIADGADVKTVDPRPMFGDNQTSLHFAVGFDDEKLIDSLVQHGADVNAQTLNGQTPLWLACND